jgi:NAD(P) transhydrogenase
MHLASSNALHQTKALKKFKIDYLQATATVISANNVLVQRIHNEPPAVLQCDHVLLATGSKPMRPIEIPFDDTRIFDSDTINTLNFLPKSVAIVGSGIIAIEYAKIFRKLGVKVSMLVRSGVLSALERIGLDSDIANKLINVLREDDVDIFESTTIENFDVPLHRRDPIALKLKSSQPDVPSVLKVDVFLAAAGRVPNVHGWGAEKLGLRLAKRGGFVEVDDRYETSVPGVFAAGDIIGPPALASTGVYQAQQAVLEVFNEGHMNKYKSFPVGMWTTPECGYFGMTLAAAKKEGIDAQEGCVDYSACLRGRVFAPVGLLKLVFRVDDGMILGVHILGEDACELVHYGMDLVCQGVSIFKVMTTCFTAVTFHELFKEAALDGNSKLEFGLEYHKVLNDIGVHMDNHEHGVDLEKMNKIFKEADTKGDGRLDETELMVVFKNYGCDVSRATVHNLVRLVDTTGDGTVHWEQFQKVFDVLDQVRSNSHFSKEGSEKRRTSIVSKEPAKQESAKDTSTVPASKEPEKKEPAKIIVPKIAAELPKPVQAPVLTPPPKLVQAPALTPVPAPAPVQDQLKELEIRVQQQERLAATRKLPAP